MRWEIVERQVAALIDCTADATLLLRFYGIAMMNAIELSHLYKCLHPSIDQAPLLVQHGLATLLELVVGQGLDKGCQRSNWGSTFLSGAQLLCKH